MVLGSSHRHVVELMAGASAQGRVTLTLRRRTFTPTGEHNVYCLALQKSSFIVLLSFSVFPTFTVLLCSITVQADVIFLYLVENSFCYCSVAHVHAKRFHTLFLVMGVVITVKEVIGGTGLCCGPLLCCFFQSCTTAHWRCSSRMTSPSPGGRMKALDLSSSHPSQSLAPP